MKNIETKYVLYNKRSKCFYCRDRADLKTVNIWHTEFIDSPNIARAVANHYNRFKWVILPVEITTTMILKEEVK